MPFFTILIEYSCTCFMCFWLTIGFRLMVTNSLKILYSFLQKYICMKLSWKLKKLEPPPKKQNKKIIITESYSGYMLFEMFTFWTVFRNPPPKQTLILEHSSKERGAVANEW